MGVFDDLVPEAPAAAPAQNQFADLVPKEKQTLLGEGLAAGDTLESQGRGRTSDGRLPIGSLPS